MDLFKDLIVEKSHFDSVPWSKEDVKLGIFLSLAITISIITIIILFKNIIPKDLINYFTVFSHLPMIIIIWILALKKYKVGFKFLGIKQFSLKMIVLGILLLLLSKIIIILYYRILRVINFQIDIIDYTKIFKSDTIPLSLFINLVVIAPLIEELYYRGFLFGGFVKHFGWNKSAIICSIIFALAHGAIYNPENLFIYFTIGYLFSFLYYKSKSLFPGIIMHSLNNFIALIIIF